VPPQRYRVGVRFRSEEDVRSVAALARSGDVVAAALAALPRQRTVHPVLSVRDPGPALTLVTRARDGLRRRAATPVPSPRPTPSGS
jgi:hypothetical protein